MKILVIGSKGFIGEHLLRHFRTTGHETFGCDVVVEYNDNKYFQVDATNASYDEIFISEKFDICINASGASSVPDSFAHPSRDFHLNARNIYVILDAIKKFQPHCRFLNLSSAAVYGNPESLPIAESMGSKPLSPYGWHKHYSEMICEEFRHFFGISTCSVRIFSAYGPGLKKQIFWDWFQKIKQSTTITLFGTGNESRDFIFIDDIVHALECVVQRSEFSGEVINVANGEEIRISQAIEVFKSKLNRDFTFSFNNHVRVGDPLNWRADIAKLKGLGYTRTKSFSEGIEIYVGWLNETA